MPRHLHAIAPSLIVAHFESTLYLTSLTALKELHLFGNKFTTLPKPIVKLTSLTKLYLMRNQLVTLTDSMAALTALEKLYLHDNPLAKPQSSTVEA